MYLDQASFCPAHLDLPTSSLLFGNIVENNVFYAHRIVLPPAKFQHDHLVAINRVLGEEFRKNTTEFMFTNLEYDRKMFITKFPLTRRNKAFPDDKKTNYDAVVFITSKYSNFRRIIADVQLENCNGHSMKLIFNLFSPMIIRMKKFDHKVKNGFYHDTNTFGERYRCWEKPLDKHSIEEISESNVFMVQFKAMDEQKCNNILDRLQSTTKLTIERRTMKVENFPIEDRAVSPFDDTKLYSYLVDRTSFALRYLLAALLSRGAIVKNQFLRKNHVRDEFLNEIIHSYRIDKKLTLETLERLLTAVDEKLELESLKKLFLSIRESLKQDNTQLQQIHNEHIADGYVRVRKIIITPSRMLYVAPELLMSNRVLRHLDPIGDKTIRVIFRDEDGGKPFRNNLGDFLIDNIFHQYLKDGIEVAGDVFRFLGSSNSQLRDNGCYFFFGEPEEMIKIRQDLGRFKLEGVPKIMSRIGQCFTQAKIRFRGFKGVMSVDTLLDKKKLWGKKHGVVDKKKETKKLMFLDLIFRKSQEKFHGRSDDAFLEIVKYSMPTGVALNKPMINIMDQVSSKQSRESHTRISDRIHWLVDHQLHEISQFLIDEQKCRIQLNEFPKLMFGNFCDSKFNDYKFTQEPFFRSLVKAAAKYSLKKMLSKLQIPIPSFLGRSMFGVLDETGELQYGQVFVQYTKNLSLKKPGENAKRVIYEGPILVTKNPQIVAGDVRMFTAVNILGLSHLTDVIVFPRHGPRPHADEMAGSDLDGDEYTVIWDQELFLEKNEEPFDFSSEPNRDKVKEEELNEKMCEFFVNYMKLDSIGTIANNFLNNADQYGIYSKVCKKIAKKNSQALDFPKTGQAPEPLKSVWKNNHPPEKCERWADFFEKNHEPAYASSRLVGQLYRRIKEVDDFLSIALNENEVDLVESDRFVDIPGWESAQEVAKEDFLKYTAQVQNLLDSYSIPNESELFSNCYTSLKNRISSQQESEDLSLFNTAHIIEQRLAQIFGMFRKSFFEKFGRFHDLTTTNEKFGNYFGPKDVFRRFCDRPNENMKRLACAYYKISYGEAQTENSRRYLSFPWLVWDIITEIRRENMTKQKEFNISADPLSENLSKHIQEFVENHTNSRGVKKIKKFVKEIKDEVKCLGDYVDKYQGLDELMYFTCQWAEKQELFYKNLKNSHLCLTLIMFGRNLLASMNFEVFTPWLEETTNENNSNQKIDLRQQRGGLGRKFLNFIKFLASRQFAKIKKLDFLSDGLNYCSFLFDSDWIPLHVAALKSFYHVSFTNRFEILPCIDRLHDTQISTKEKFCENEPFIIEIPRKNEQAWTISLNEKLRQKSRCAYVTTRKLPFKKESDTVRMIVSASGTAESLQKLRKLLMVRINPNVLISSRQDALMLTAQAYENLFDLHKN